VRAALRDRDDTAVGNQVHNRTPVLLEFLVRLPSVTSTGRLAGAWDRQSKVMATSPAPQLSNVRRACP